MLSNSTGKRFPKILCAAAEDWFVLSHFRPLIETLRGLCDELVVVTRCTGRRPEIEALGARVIPLPFHRKSFNLLRQGKAAREFARIIQAEKPDIVHLIALNPIVIGAAAARLCTMRAVVAHVTGLGYLGTATRLGARVARQVSFGLVARMLQERVSWVLAENDSDLSDLEAFGVYSGSNRTILGGAGIDPEVYRALPQPSNAVPIAASISRLIHSKGLDVLVAAKERLDTRGVPLRVQIYGRPDKSNPEAISPEVLRDWLSSGTIEGGHETRDVIGVWRGVDIAVLPTRSREGMPRSMLEAAACARPIIATDVPGLRDFIRDGQEGLIVQPDDPVSLADALERLAGDAELRARMGAAARERVLSGFTDAHLMDTVTRVYEELDLQTRARENGS